MPAVADIPKTFRPQSYYIRSAWDFTAGSVAVAAAKSLAGAAEQLAVASKLGRQGLQRIQQFRTYGPGWDFGGGVPMSEAAYRLMCRFLPSLSLPEGVRPSVFLTSEGHLELSWERGNGASVQVEFGPDLINYFDGETGMEQQVVGGEAGQLAKALSV
jgi:hypothetical protein